MTQAPRVFKSERSVDGQAIAVRACPFGPQDVDLIVRHRHEVFEASGHREEILAPEGAAFRIGLRSVLAQGP